MNANAPLTSDVQQHQEDKRRKRKAILAGGLVLGLGAAVTLAAWSDDVFAFGDFQTGQFELQGNVYNAESSTVYEDYDETPGGALAFRIAPLNMAPGDTVYAPISIATSEETSTGAEVTLLGATTDAADTTLFDALRYEVRTLTAGGTCDAATFAAATTWHAQSALGVGEAAAFQVGAEGTDPEHLCFAVTLPENDTTTADAMQNLRTGPVVWQFEGESLPAS